MYISWFCNINLWKFTRIWCLQIGLKHECFLLNYSAYFQTFVPCLPISRRKPGMKPCSNDTSQNLILEDDIKKKINFPGIKLLHGIGRPPFVCKHCFLSELPSTTSLCAFSAQVGPQREVCQSIVLETRFLVPFLICLLLLGIYISENTQFVKKNPRKLSWTFSAK